MTKDAKYRYEAKIMGGRLSRLMDAKKITSAELAAVAGVTYSTIGRYKTGNRKPSIAKLRAMEQYLGVQEGYIGNEKVPYPEPKKVIKSRARPMPVVQSDVPRLEYWKTDDTAKMVHKLAMDCIERLGVDAEYLKINYVSERAREEGYQ